MVIIDLLIVLVTSDVILDSTTSVDISITFFTSGVASILVLCIEYILIYSKLGSIFFMVILKAFVIRFSALPPLSGKVI